MKKNNFEVVSEEELLKLFNNIFNNNLYIRIMMSLGSRIWGYCTGITTQIVIGDNQDLIILKSVSIKIEHKYIIELEPVDFIEMEVFYKRLPEQNFAHYDFYDLQICKNKKEYQKNNVSFYI